MLPNVEATSNVKDVAELVAKGVTRLFAGPGD